MRIHTIIPCVLITFTFAALIMTLFSSYCLYKDIYGVCFNQTISIIMLIISGIIFSKTCIYTSISIYVRYKRRMQYIDLENTTETMLI